MVPVIEQLEFTSSAARRVYGLRLAASVGSVSLLIADEAVERVLEFERGWASFELPRYLMAVSRIQRAVFEPRGLPFGDYSTFASRVECVFTNPVAAALDEYGIPLQVAIRVVQAIEEPSDLDNALTKIRRFNFSNLDLDEFERDIFDDA